jgi:hypothetical protein
MRGYDYSHITKLDVKGKLYNLYYDPVNQYFTVCLGDYIKKLELGMSEDFIFDLVPNRDKDDKISLYIDGTLCYYDLDDFELDMSSDNIEDLCEEVLNSRVLDEYILKMLKRHSDQLLSEFEESKTKLELELEVIKNNIFLLKMLETFKE